MDQDHPVVLYHLEGHVEFAGDLVWVSLIHGFRGPVFERVDQLQRGLPPGAVFDAGAVDACPGVVGVLPVDELVDERAAFLAVEKAAIDEDGVFVFVVVSVFALRQICAFDVDAQVVCIFAHLPVCHR